MIGVPFTAGFVSKLNLVRAAAENGWWWAAGVIVVTSVLAIFYIGRILLVAYFQDPPEYKGEVVQRHEAPLMMLIPMWTLVILSIVIGVNSEWMVQAADGAAKVLMTGGGL